MSIPLPSSHNVSPLHPLSTESSESLSLSLWATLSKRLVEHPCRWVWISLWCCCHCISPYTVGRGCCFERFLLRPLAFRVCSLFFSSSGRSSLDVLLIRHSARWLRDAHFGLRWQRFIFLFISVVFRSLGVRRVLAADWMWVIPEGS